MNNPSARNDLAALLQVENDSELIDYYCPETHLPVWPLVRVSVLRSIMSDWLYKSAPLSMMGKNINYKKIAWGVGLSVLHNWSSNISGKRDILIQSTGLGNYVHDGITRDRLSGYFYEVLPEETLVYQDKPKEHLGQKYFFRPLMHRAPRNIAHKTYSKLAVNAIHKDLARVVLERVSRNAVNRLGYYFTPDRVHWLVNSLASSIAVLPFSVDSYANWFSKCRFKLLLKEDACYGGNDIALIHAARLNNMVVAEYQHGAISRGHDAYNVADALVASKSFHKILPEYLLTYGNWWSNQANIPVKKIAVGNPHLSESIAALAPVAERKKKVLVLGDGIETDLYLELASRVYEIVRNQGMTVAFRPHPFERDRIRSMQLPSGVVLDKHPDIYPSLIESRVVISELSTGLFEAAGISDMVFLWDTPKSRFAFPELPFQSFSTIEELEAHLNVLNFSHDSYNSIPADELWKPNWKQNYRRFVEGVLGK
jgi:hypothetical protein